MKEFILQNWRLIVELISMIVVVLFFFIKKKPVKVVDTLRTILLEKLPEWINFAEEAGERNSLTGQEKLVLVLTYARNYLSGLDIPESIIDVDFLKEAIENILSTPKKKER